MSMKDILEKRNKRITKAQIITLIVGIILLLGGFIVLMIGQKMEYDYANTAYWELYEAKVNKMYDFCIIYLSITIVLSLFIEFLLYIIKITMYLKPKKDNERHIGFY